MVKIELFLKTREQFTVPQPDILISLAGLESEIVGWSTGLNNWVCTFQPRQNQINNTHKFKITRL